MAFFLLLDGRGVERISDVPKCRDCPGIVQPNAWRGGQLGVSDCLASRTPFAFSFLPKLLAHLWANPKPKILASTCNFELCPIWNLAVQKLLDFSNQLVREDLAKSNQDAGLYLNAQVADALDYLKNCLNPRKLQY